MNNIPAPNTRAPAKKKRRRRKLGCLAPIIWFVCVIGVSALFAGIAWLCADDLLSLTKDDLQVTIVVEDGDTVGDIAGKLKDMEVIKYPWLFELYGWFSEAEEKIDTGSYEINAAWDYRALVSAMREKGGYRSTVKVTIPEGFTLKQALQRLAEEGVNSYDVLLETSKNYDFEYSFLEDLPSSETRLEGYLFPNTHDFYVGESSITAINRLLADFNKKFKQDLRDRAETKGLTMHEVLTIASLIQKEAANKNEMPEIASVIFNRLNSENMRKLQIDATIQYILPERKEHLTTADTQIDNLYNTYMYEGLPPGPICNPGIDAINAVLYPADTKYYYYALTEDGTHKFSRTFEEHQKVIADNPGVYRVSN